MTSFLRILFIMSICWDLSSAQDSFQLLGVKCPKRCREETTTATVMVRPWPISSMPRGIPMLGATLASVIDEPSLVSLPAEILFQRIKMQDLSPGDVASTDRATILFRTGTTNAVLLGRGNRILVFPRVLLLHPSIQKLQIRDADFVATVLADKGLKPETAVADDRLRHLLLRYQDREGDGDFEIRLGGSMLPIPAGIQKPSSPQLSSTIKNIEDELRSTGFEIPENNTPVFVLTRRIGVNEIVYICPLRTFGVFREDGPLMQKLAAGDKRDAVNLWNYHCDDSLRAGKLHAGDTIEITQLELAVLTSRFAL